MRTLVRVPIIFVLGLCLGYIAALFFYPNPITVTLSDSDTKERLTTLENELRKSNEHIIWLYAFIGHYEDDNPDLEDIRKEIRNTLDSIPIDLADRFDKSNRDPLQEIIQSVRD